MPDIQPFKLSVLDLSPVPEQGSADQAFRHSLALARFAESAGFARYWLAEHHSMKRYRQRSDSYIDRLSGR